MASVNKVILIGNLGKDPEARYLPSGDAVTTFSIATSEKWKKDGEEHEHTEWHSITTFGKLAEIASEYLKKGMPVYVEGRIRTDKWDKDDQTHYRTKIIADRMQFLGKRENGEKRELEQSTKQQAPKQKTGSSFDQMDDDIPF